jgi:glycosyltransferase involved in cell wall biosynthesis
MMELSMGKQISISAIMLIYNQAYFLRKAIFNILNQSFTNFELILINDGSTDESLSVIQSITDSRIVVYDFKDPAGTVERFNFGISIAKGDYLVRIHPEDISVAKRFEKQIDFFNRHVNHGACGSLIDLIDENGFKLDNGDIARSHDQLKIDLLFGIPFLSSTLMIKRSILTQNSIKYKQEYRGYEDYKILVELSCVSKVSNLPDVLLKHGMPRAKVGKTICDEIILSKICKEQLTALGVKLNRLELESHLALFFQMGSPSPKIFDPQKVISWFKKLNEANQRSLVYNNHLFKRHCLFLMDYILSTVLSKTPFEK